MVHIYFTAQKNTFFLNFNFYKITLGLISKHRDSKNDWRGFSEIKMNNLEFLNSYKSKNSI